jgi:PilZ domain
MRVPRAEPVELRWQDQAGQPQHGVAHLADISGSGASIRTPRPLRMGTALSLHYQNEEFPATVKHCVKRGAIYLLGIEFQAGHRWSLRPQ